MPVRCAKTNQIRSRIPGAIDVTCTQCNAVCSASPVTQKFLQKNPDAKVYCNECFHKKFTDIKFALMPGQSDELAAKLGGY